MSATTTLSRRALLVTGAAALASAPAIAAPSWPATRRLVFEAWRGKHLIGHHSLNFSGDDKSGVIRIEAVMAVNLGPITVFRYHHQASETWRGGAFAELHSETVTNGARETVAAVRTARGLSVTTASGVHALPAGAAPLTHWNPRVLEGPLFNPQTGRLMRESVSRQEGQVLRVAGARPIPATRYALAGEADIVDWYDTGGVWTALTAKARDGSVIDYRRVS